MNQSDRYVTARTRGVRCALILGVAAVAGCSRPLAPPIRSGEPVGVQLMRTEPSFVGQAFRVLVDFESGTDFAFIADCPGGQIDPAVAHTGNSSLHVPPGAKPFVVKLSSLLPGGPADFPGAWTLVGAYFISRESTAVRVSYEVKGKAILQRSVGLEARKWTAVFLDVTSLSDPNGEPPGEVGLLRFAPERGAETWCDDVVVLDNTRSLAGDADKAGDAWSVRQRGFYTLIEKPGSFAVRIPTPESGEGDAWKAEEANDLRVRLTAAGGRRTRVIYSDGREYVDGGVKSLAETSAEQQAQLNEQHRAPAALSVPEEMGRVERNSPGDANHDGYNEAVGAYELKAAGPRFEVTVTPQGPKVVRPVLEIAGLPTGHVVAHAEGQVIEKLARLPNGHVLVMLPTTIDRPVTVNVRVQ
jgi:hypothetical protein